MLNTNITFNKEFHKKNYVRTVDEKPKQYVIILKLAF